MSHVALSVVIGFLDCSVYIYMCSPISDCCAKAIYFSQSRFPVSQFDTTEVLTLESQMGKGVTLHIRDIR
jgi:hypothetical protein